MGNQAKKGKPVVNCDREDTWEEVADLFNQYNVGCVVVTDGDEPVGIITDRDLAIALGTSRLAANEIVAEDIMQSPIETLDAGSGFLKVVKKLSDARVRRLPVTNEDGELVDIFTMDDVIQVLSESLTELEEIIEAEKPKNTDDFL